MVYTRPFERSRLRGGRFACDTPYVIDHGQATILICLTSKPFTPQLLIQIP
jgi:hypothetical protein